MSRSHLWHVPLCSLYLTPSSPSGWSSRGQRLSPLLTLVSNPSFQDQRAMGEAQTCSLGKWTWGRGGHEARAFLEEAAGAQVHPTAASTESLCGLTHGASISDVHSVTLGVPAALTSSATGMVQYPGQWQSVKWKTRLGGRGFTGKDSSSQSWGRDSFQLSLRLGRGGGRVRTGDGEHKKKQRVAQLCQLRPRELLHHTASSTVLQYYSVLRVC